MPLQSKLFGGDPVFEACLLKDSAHITPGAKGKHVSKIHTALAVLDNYAVAAGELSSGAYGGSTAAGVLAYKRKRKIINPSYQTQADNIVGKMTIAALDAEMFENEKVSPPPPPAKDPKDAALEVRDRALLWTNNALRLIQAYRHFLKTPGGLIFDSSPLFDFTTFAIHFQMHKDRQNEFRYLWELDQHYTSIRLSLSKLDAISHTVTDEVAAAESPDYAKGGFIPAYAWPVNYPPKMAPGIRFTKHFPNLGPNCRAAILLHECSHYIGHNIMDGPEKGPAYDAMSTDRAVHNACCYPNFAEHVTPPFRDERYGLSRPND